MPEWFRLATENDAQGVLSIYGPIIEHTVISFELDIPPLDDIAQRITDTLRTHPWLICEIDGMCAGYAYAGPHRVRKAYQWSTDVTVYIHQSHRRKGLGRKLYTILFEILKLQGFYNAYAGATLPNNGSLGLHRSLGFQDVGIYQSVGYKFGAWHDVIWLQLSLNDVRAEKPNPPLTLAEVQFLGLLPANLDKLGDTL